MKYKTKILQLGNNTGIEVPEEIVQQLGAGKKPPIVVMLNNYSYRSTVAVMGGKYLVPLSAANRQNASVKGGDELEIDLSLDHKPRTVEIPPELREALDKNKPAKVAFGKLSYTKKKEIVVAINEAKKEETRTRRIEKAIAGLTKN